MPGDLKGHPFTGLTSLPGYPKHLHIQLKAIDLLFWPSFGRLALYFSVFKVRNLGYRSYRIHQILLSRCRVDPGRVQVAVLPQSVVDN